MHTSNTDHDETLKDFRIAINQLVDDDNMPEVLALIEKDRERVVKEARIDELKNIVSPARTNKQKHLGVAYLVEDRLAELSNPTQAKEKQ